MSIKSIGSLLNETCAEELSKVRGLFFSLSLFWDSVRRKKKTVYSKLRGFNSQGSATAGAGGCVAATPGLGAGAAGPPKVLVPSKVEGAKEFGLLVVLGPSKALGPLKALGPSKALGPRKAPAS